MGELIKPFVFLDYFDFSASDAPGFGWHPHSGIATLTVLHEGRLEYQETTGVKGILSRGGIEWMRAGKGVWHTGNALGSGRTRGFQLWIALPEHLETAPSQSHYLSAADVPRRKAARIILGSHDDTNSVIAAPDGINYLDVQLEPRERWTYQPPPGHEVAWLAVSQGVINTSERVETGELVVFEESNDAISIQAERAARFVLGSARKHPHPLVLGYYSVHTTPGALGVGESEIRRIGDQLMASGVLGGR
ncbi:MAG TPA: pirin family protein [Xanthobacteraceae bacterium]